MKKPAFLHQVVPLRAVSCLSHRVGVSLGVQRMGDFDDLHRPPWCRGVCYVGYHWQSMGNG